MAAHVVHDDDIVFGQGRYQNLLDIAEEHLASDCAVKDTRRNQAIHPQPGNEARGLPMTVRGAVDQPRAALRSTPGPYQVRLGRGFVEEYQLRRGQPCLLRPPFGPRPGNIRSGLFRGMHGLFLSVSLSLRSVSQSNVVLAAT
jgi:hypothetical protein